VKKVGNAQKIRELLSKSGERLINTLLRLTLYLKATHIWYQTLNFIISQTKEN